MIAAQLELSARDMMRLRVSDAYSIHRIVYRLFEDTRSKEEKKSTPCGFLYADRGMVSGHRRVLLLSDRTPKIPDFGTFQIKKIPDDFLSHSVYRFCVVLNATTQNKNKRIPIKGRDDILSWFSKKSVQVWGFEPISVDIKKINVIHVSKNEVRLPIQQVELFGVLRVKDQDAFKKSFRLGLGRAKAYGCGLLQIAPVA